MLTSSRSLRLVLAGALMLVAVASVAFALGMTASSSSVALAAQGTTIPGHPEMGPGWQPGGLSVSAASVQIRITAIDGGKLSLETTDGWTRTIDATGATITKGGQAIALSDLHVGDEITFRESRQSDGSYKITSIVVSVPAAAGTVTAIGDSSITIKQGGGTSRTLAVTSSTTYTQAGTKVAKSALIVGDRITAQGTVDASNNFTATSITIQPATVRGTVASKTSDTLVVTTSGTSVTVKVTSSTKVSIRGQSSPSLANISVGEQVAVQGTRNSDGSITATLIQAAANGQPGFNLGPNMPGFGGRGRFGGKWPGSSAGPSSSPSGLNG